MSLAFTESFADSGSELQASLQDFQQLLALDAMEKNFEMMIAGGRGHRSVPVVLRAIREGRSHSIRQAIPPVAEPREARPFRPFQTKVELGCDFQNFARTWGLNG